MVSWLTLSDKVDCFKKYTVSIFSVMVAPQRMGNIRPIPIPSFQGMVLKEQYPDIRVPYPEIRVPYPEIRVPYPEIRVW